MAIFDPSQRKGRLRGDPLDDQRRESSVFGKIVQVYPETCSCQIKTDDGSIYDSLPLPGLIQGYQGNGGEVFIPANGQRVELKLDGPLGTRIRGFVATPLPSVLSDATTPEIFPEGLGVTQRGRVNYRGELPQNLVSGDWCRLGGQGQYVGVFDGGVASIFGSPWAQINVLGGTNNDTVNLVARRLNVLTAFGDLKVKSDGGRHAIEFYGGLDQMTETGSNRNKWTYRGGLGTVEGFSFFSIASKSGDPIYRVNIGYDGGYSAYHSGNHITNVTGTKGVGVFGDHWRVVTKSDHVEVQGGDRTEVFKRNRTCAININNSVTVMGTSSETVQNGRVVTCQTLDHNVSGKMTSKPGDTAYGLNVTNGSWDVSIGKLPANINPSSSFNLTVESPTGKINMSSMFGNVSLSSGLETSIKALTNLKLEAAGITTVNGSVIKIGGAGANQAALKGTKVLLDLALFLRQVSSFAKAATPALPSLVTAVQGIGTSADALSAKLSAWASTKVFVA